MAWREIVKVAVMGARVVGSAFSKALKQEMGAGRQAAASREQTNSSQRRAASTDSFAGMTLSEAKKILNIEDLHDTESIERNYKHLFTVNEKSKGGSFYLQSKVVRAKARIDSEITQQNSSTSNSNR